MEAPTPPRWIRGSWDDGRVPTWAEVGFFWFVRFTPHEPSKNPGEASGFRFATSAGLGGYGASKSELLTKAIRVPSGDRESTFIVP